MTFEVRKLAAAAALFAFPGVASLALASGDAKAGATVYAAKCKSCHGADGQGNPGMAKMMKVEMKPLSASTVDVEKVIVSGQGKMKPVAGVSVADAANVAAFVKTLKK